LRRCTGETLFLYYSAGFVLYQLHDFSGTHGGRRVDEQVAMVNIAIQRKDLNLISLTDLGNDRPEAFLHTGNLKYFTPAARTEHKMIVDQ